jgi:hypothetical protein
VRGRAIRPYRGSRRRLWQLHWRDHTPISFWLLLLTLLTLLTILVLVGHAALTFD